MEPTSGTLQRPGRRAALAGAGVALALAAATLLFWKLRIVDSVVNEDISVPNADVFYGQVPMTRYAFDVLREGRLPLWNPYQLCGLPFLAVPYVGLFYPPNWMHLRVDTAVGVELSFLLHMLLAGIGTWAFARRLGLGHAAGCAGALTFMWSGFAVHWANQPQLFAGIAWTPWTLLALEHVLGGSRRAVVGLALVVALQLWNGAMEILLHTLYLGALFTLCRGVAIGRDVGAGPAVRAALWALAGVALGAGLAAVQLVPTAELVLQSARAPGELDFEDVTRKGTLAWADFVRSATRSQGIASAGVLGLVAAALGAGLSRRRSVWGFAVIAGALAVALAGGGLLFRLYYELPLGSLFRRSYKFLDLYAFAQAVLVALAVERLDGWRDARGLWREPAWWAGLLFALAAWLGTPGGATDAVTALCLLLLAFGLLPASRWRALPLAGLLALQAASLFTGVANTWQRPFQAADYAEEHYRRTQLHRVAGELGESRAYLSPRLWFMKQGLAQRLPLVTDYEPLAPTRAAVYFDRAAHNPAAVRPFNGRFFVNPTSRWRLLDLASARYYVVHPWSRVLLDHLDRAPDFRSLGDPKRRLFERPSALPRAYVVGTARVLPDGDAVLAALEADEFDPAGEVLLEQAPPAGAPARAAAGAAGRAHIVRDAPEEVVVAVEAERDGFLVLTDAHYPGWQAEHDGHALPILRANYLFRAVPVRAGSSRVRFAYRPASLAWGALGTALAAGLAAALWIRSARSAPAAAEPSGGGNARRSGLGEDPLAHRLDPAPSRR